MREFGLFMAISVGVNYMLAITLFPAAIAFEDAYIMRGGREGGEGGYDQVTSHSGETEEDEEDSTAIDFSPVSSRQDVQDHPPRRDESQQQGCVPGGSSLVDEMWRR